MRVYHGERTDDGCKVTVDGLPLPVRSDLSGAVAAFDWGYVGNGQLSLALLSDLLGDGQKAKSLFKVFERGVLADLPHDSWTVSDDDFAAALARVAGATGPADSSGIPSHESDLREVTSGSVAFGDMPFQTGHLVTPEPTSDSAADTDAATEKGQKVHARIAFGDMPMATEDDRRSDDGRLAH